ncbi:MAG: hypothetical protein J6Q18_00035, partial [Oscillospiraceae bacterium]|nr:hypothetical protein [Oscillospiraceae bacterium]
MSIKRFKDTFNRLYRNSVYRIWLWVLGFFTVLVTYFRYKSLKGKDMMLLTMIQENLSKAAYEQQQKEEAEKQEQEVQEPEEPVVKSYVPDEVVIIAVDGEMLDQQRGFTGKVGKTY